MPSRNSPENLIEQAAQAAFDAVTEFLESEDARAKTIFVAITSDGLTEAENAIVAGQGFEGAGDILTTLLMHAKQVGDELGVQIVIAPMPGWG